CVDVDAEKVARLSAGEVSIYEQNLEKMLQRNLEQGRISFVTDLANAVRQSDVIFLALPTPAGANGAADLSFVLNVAEEIGGLLTDYKIIVNKSTVPVGTAHKVRAAIAAQTELPFDVVSNPEFLR